jgi:hypothetical protein
MPQHFKHLLHRLKDTSRYMCKVTRKLGNKCSQGCYITAVPDP